MLKAELRKQYLSKLKDLSLSERQKLSARISESFFLTFDLKEFKILHLFLSIEENKEIETRFIYEKIWRDFPAIKTVVPRVNRSIDEIESLEFNRLTELSLSSWKIPEPVGERLTEPSQIDLVLVPLLCFDEFGFRVGYGKGYYDKYLNKCRKDCLKIGLSYFPPIEKISDINKFDVPLEYCVTPEKVYRF